MHPFQRCAFLETPAGSSVSSLPMNEGIFTHTFRSLPFAPFARDFELPRHPVEEASVFLLTVFIYTIKRWDSPPQLEMDASTPSKNTKTCRKPNFNNRHLTPKKLHKFSMNWIWRFFVGGGRKVFVRWSFTSRFILVESHVVFLASLGGIMEEIHGKSLSCFKTSKLLTPPILPCCPNITSHKMSFQKSPQCSLAMEKNPHGWSTWH